MAGQAAVGGFVDHPDLHRVFGVVEVHHVDVEDQNGRAGDEPSCRGGAQRERWDGARETGPNAGAGGLTDSRFPVGHVGRDGDPPPLPRAQTLQGLVHPLDHVAQAHVGVVGAVALVADGTKPEGLF